MPYDPRPHLRPERCALILFECQEAVIGPETRLQGLRQDVVDRDLVGNLSTVLEAARETGVLVTYCNMAFRPDGLGAPNTPRADHQPTGPAGPAEASPVVTPLEPRSDELVLERIHGMSTFYGTPLEPVLRDRGITTIIPAGVSLNIGIVATTVEALNRGFRIVIARECCAGDPTSYAEDVYRNTLNNLAYLTTSEDLVAAWRSHVDHD